MSKHVAAGVAGAGFSAVIANFFWGKSSSPSSTDTSSPTSSSSSSSSLPVSRPSSPVPSKGSSPVNPSEFFKYGFPGPVHDLQTHQEFVSCYDRQKRNPYYVIEHLTPESLQRKGETDRKKSIFKEDEQIPTQFRAQLRDYFRSGYDRGHQAPAADAKFSQQAMDETFFLTNISPQVGDGFNRDYWAHLEFFCRDMTKAFPSVRVVTGPLYLPKKCADGKWRVEYEVIGNPPNIAVPTHFFKLIVGEKSNGDLSVGAFVLPNDVISNDTPLQSFEVPVDALEKSSGLMLLQNVPAGRKKQLCKEVKCEITVREFGDAAKKLPPKKDMLLLPPPK
ncbi:CYFA0S17e02168g1_1 [Cyberlindnera fabianii]|uniref:Endonuclease n=1 Tax=Cyberlindnera fabianii TaxID=36022 RepID=A0A061BBT5_CYBFA|nr:CYFA0S17e02168g1_1 [Cyberlindnera fabianii]